jgi:protein tyrosine phosphatase (PTP) superfamily phosphohydrolase (DUF442 family)
MEIQAQWHRVIILATQKVEVQDQPGQKSKQEHLSKSTLGWWYMPVILATLE